MQGKPKGLLAEREQAVLGLRGLQRDKAFQHGKDEKGTDGDGLGPVGFRHRKQDRGVIRWARARGQNDLLAP